MPRLRTETNEVEVFEESAWAKVNLYLHVLGQRKDGYHELDSLMVFANAGDRITLRYDPTASQTDACNSLIPFTMNGQFSSSLEGLKPSGNLAVRAVHALGKILGQPTCGISVHLEKNLPVAAGIGGGSADAAAVIRALCRLWHVRMNDPRVMTTAEQLGADVPACIAALPLRARGIGERLEPLTTFPSGLCLLLANPGIPLATPPVFRARKGLFDVAAPTPLPNLQNLYDVAALMNETNNSLEAAARSLCPQIGAVLESLSLQKGCVTSRLSGSGPTCFGLFESLKAAKMAEQSLQTAHTNWWLQPAFLLTKAQSSNLA